MQRLTLRSLAVMVGILGTLLFVPPAQAGWQRARPEVRRVTERESYESRRPSERETQERRERWERLSVVERARLSEQIGERRMTFVAEQKMGYKGLMEMSARSERPQGFDAVFWDVARREIVVGEAKGGYSSSRDVRQTLGRGYGEPQASIAWAREAARSVLRSETSNYRERRQAQGVLEAIYAGRCRVEVYWTPVVEGTARRTSIYEIGRQRGGDRSLEREVMRLREELGRWRPPE
jgi:hypothetical protein